MRSREWLAAVAIGVGAFAVPSIVDAHHTTISCTARETSTWSIVNSENISMEYTIVTADGHQFVGIIGPKGTDTIVYVGTSLTVKGLWSNGVRNTSVGSGDCVPEATTTTSTSTTASTVPATVPSSTSVPPTTGPPPPGSSVAPPSTFPNESPPQIPPPSTVPVVPVAPEVTSTSPSTSVAAPPGQTLPETGSAETGLMALCAAAVLAFGFGVRRAARR